MLIKKDNLKQRLSKNLKNHSILALYRLISENSYLILNLYTYTYIKILSLQRILHQYSHFQEKKPIVMTLRDLLHSRQILTIYICIYISFLQGSYIHG